VDVVAGMTETLEVVMVPDRACIDVTPMSFEVWVVTGTQELRAQNLLNAGGAALT
jgi:hypothetical protein